MYHPLRKQFLYSAYKVRSHFSDFGAPKICSGTGFFVQNSVGQIFLITNRHVVDAQYEKVERNWELNEIEISGFTSEEYDFFKGRLEDPSCIRYSPNFDEDVAAIKVERIRTPGSGELRVINVESELIADEKYFSELLPGDFIAMSGYPEWHDRHSNRPIMRSGTLSSDPSVDYTGPNQPIGARRRAVEMFSFGGSSGSPVYAQAAGMNLGTGLVGGYYRPERLIGVNAGHLHVAGTDKHHSGISYMFTSMIIRELIEN